MMFNKDLIDSRPISELPSKRGNAFTRANAILSVGVMLSNPESLNKCNRTSKLSFDILETLLRAFLSALVGLILREILERRREILNSVRKVKRHKLKVVSVVSISTAGLFFSLLGAGAKVSTAVEEPIKQWSTVQIPPREQWSDGFRINSAEFGSFSVRADGNMSGNNNVLVTIQDPSGAILTPQRVRYILTNEGNREVEGENPFPCFLGTTVSGNYRLVLENTDSLHSVKAQSITIISGTRWLYPTDLTMLGRTLIAAPFLMVCFYVAYRLMKKSDENRHKKQPPYVV